MKNSILLAGANGNRLILGASGNIGSFLYKKLSPAFSTTGLGYGDESSVKDFLSYLLIK